MDGTPFPALAVFDYVAVTVQVPAKITPGPPKSGLSVRVGDSSLGAIISVAALLSALALIWTVRLS